jgi:predicted ATPase
VFLYKRLIAVILVVFCVGAAALLAKPQKFVITGGPCAGKTTVIDELNRLGYHIVHEAATFLINEAKQKNEKPPYEVNLQKFQDDIATHQLDLDLGLDNTDAKIAFLDRSIIDSLAYYAKDKLVIPDKFKKAAEDARYQGKNGYEQVFIFDFLETYEKTEVRQEDQKTAQSIHDFIKHQYESFGYKSIIVPAFQRDEQGKFLTKEKSIEKRVQFVLDHVNRVEAINNSLKGLDATQQVAHS